MYKHPIIYHFFSKDSDTGTTEGNVILRKKGHSHLKNADASKCTIFIYLCSIFKYTEQNLRVGEK